MITNPTRGPDVMNMFAPQVTDDRINICWIARKTAGGLECIVRVSLRIGNPLYTEIERQHHQQSNLDRCQRRKVPGRGESESKRRIWTLLSLDMLQSREVDDGGNQKMQ